MESISLGDDSGQFLGVRRVDEVDLRELAQGDEVLEEVLVLEGLDVGEVVVHVAGGGVSGGLGRRMVVWIVVGGGWFGR